MRSAAATSAELEPSRLGVIPTESPAPASVLERLLTTCPAHDREGRCAGPAPPGPAPPLPAGGAGPAPLTCARTPTQRAARRRQRGPAPIYTVLFWSCALIGRPRVTTHSRAAGRGDIRGKSASGGPVGGWYCCDPRGLCSESLSSRPILGVLWALHDRSSIFRLGYILMKEPVWPKRVAKNQTLVILGGSCCMVLHFLQATWRKHTSRTRCQATVAFPV